MPVKNELILHNMLYINILTRRNAAETNPVPEHTPIFMEKKGQANRPG